MKRSAGLAAKRSEKERVGHETRREAIGDPPAKLRPGRVEERVRRDGSEVDDIDWRPNRLSKP